MPHQQGSEYRSRFESDAPAQLALRALRAFKKAKCNSLRKILGRLGKMGKHLGLSASVMARVLLVETGNQLDDDGVYLSVSTIMFDLFTEVECSEEMTAQVSKMVVTVIPLQWPTDRWPFVEG